MKQGIKDQEQLTLVDIYERVLLARGLSENMKTLAEYNEGDLTSAAEVVFEYIDQVAYMLDRYMTNANKEVIA